MNFIFNPKELVRWEPVPELLRRKSVADLAQQREEGGPAAPGDPRAAPRPHQPARPFRTGPPWGQRSTPARPAGRRPSTSAYPFVSRILFGLVCVFVCGSVWDMRPGARSYLNQTACILLPKIGLEGCK
jgi:hypothetical protein